MEIVKENGEKGKGEVYLELIFSTINVYYRAIDSLHRLCYDTKNSS